MFLHSCDLLEGTFGLEALQGGKKNLKINQKVSRMHSPRLGKLSASPLANSLHQNRASQNEGKRTGREPVRLLLVAGVFSLILVPFLPRHGKILSSNI